MVVIRKQRVAINDISEYEVGDQIKIGKYTATCQKILSKGAVFMLDQYLDKTYRMVDIEKDLQNDFESDIEFNYIREQLIPFADGEIVRLPSVNEMFEGDWELMKIRKNRIADRNHEDNEWGWIDSRIDESYSFSDVVTSCGERFRDTALNFNGVRPVFLLGKN